MGFNINYHFAALQYSKVNGCITISILPSIFMLESNKVNRTSWNNGHSTAGYTRSIQAVLSTNTDIYPRDLYPGTIDWHGFCTNSLLLYLQFSELPIRSWGMRYLILLIPWSLRSSISSNRSVCLKKNMEQFVVETNSKEHEWHNDQEYYLVQLQNTLPSNHLPQSYVTRLFP